MGSSIYLVMTYSTTYLTAVVGFEWGPRSDVVLAGVIAIVLAPISGKIGDKFARRKNYLVLASILVARWPWCGSSSRHPPPPQARCWHLDRTVHAFGLLLRSPDGDDERPASRLRSTGSAIGYNVAIAVFGGSAPFIASSLIAWTKDPSSPVWFFLLTALVSVGGLLLIRDKDLLSKKTTSRRRFFPGLPITRR